jgi:hypothetical protein
MGAIGRHPAKASGALMSKETTAIYFAWFKQVAGDPTQSASAFKLAFTYQQHMNNNTGAAFVGQERLAKLNGVSGRSVRTLTDMLKTGGHLAVEVNHGPNQANVCRLILNRKSASALDADTQKFLKPVSIGEPEAGFLINEEISRIKTGSLVQRTGNSAPKNRKPASDELSSNHDYSNEGDLSETLGALGAGLRARLGPDKLHSWFRTATIAHVGPDIVTLEFGTRFLADYVAANFMNDLTGCCKAVYPTIERVKVIAA